MKQTRMPQAEVESKPVFEDLKEVKPLYAVMTEEKILDLQSLEVAQKIAKKTNSAVWEMLRDGNHVTFIYPINR